MKILKSPLKDKDLKDLKSGDKVFIAGKIIVARDMAHKRFLKLLNENKNLPFNPKGQIIFYMGPSPAPKNKIIGSAGPTTSGRMDSFTPALLNLGVKALIGKGKRSVLVKKSLLENKAIYLSTLGGAGALLGSLITKVRPLAFEDLGPEAVLEIEVQNFPAIVINDIYGNDFYEENIKNYRTINIT